jgi:uncharacterized protein YjiS (DUF1127 family)
MSETPTKLIKIDGEWTYVPLTAEEIAEREARALEAQERYEQEQAELEARQALKQAGLQKLIDLGLSEAEAKALIP